MSWLFIFLLVCNLKSVNAKDDYVAYLKPLLGINLYSMNDPKVSVKGDAKWYVEKGSSQSHFFYVLLRDDNVVYCGITNDPERRTEEHHVSKTFDRMIAAGRLSENGARLLEKNCVCEYNPILNKLPKCHLYTFGGGYKDNNTYQESNYVQDSLGDWYYIE